MSNITPSKPSFVFGYWRPWKENSNLFDSYLDYSRDTSLVKYGADMVGQYINQASKEQVQAINQLGQAIGRGIDVLSNQMSDINETLVFLNRNMDVQVEQQKLSNLLLQNIAELLRVPDSEKERQHSIELGIKFFVNASKDADLYADALEQLLKAENLMKQDYFVLHRIGCIYLYAEKYINPVKALEYFLKAAKYASVESDPQALRLANFLANNLELNSTNESANENRFNIAIIKGDIPNLVWQNVSEVLINSAHFIHEDKNKLSIEDIDQVFVDGMQKSIDIIKAEGGIVEISRSQLSTNKIDDKHSTVQLDKINYLVAESYERAAFCAYILGRFSDAINYQTKALKFNVLPQNRFLLAKYQVRNGEISEGVKNLSQCIDDEPVFAVATFKEIDLINEPEVLKLISNKNQEIDNEINKLHVKWEKVESTAASDVVKELTELSQKSYEIKISQFNSFEKKANDVNKSIKVTASEIDAFITQIKKNKFCTLDSNAIQLKIDTLQNAKDLPIEKMIEVFNIIKNEVNDDKLKIGAKYAGGIVFYIDNTGNHGLVFADKDFGEAKWGGVGEIGAVLKSGLSDGHGNGHGMSNTKKIVEHASWHIKQGFFNTTKTPAPTAARLCLESNHNGFSDWYLPTIKELELIYETHKKNKLGNFRLQYWSSTESDASRAWSFDFYNGNANYCFSKSFTYYVRAVRAF